MLLIVAAALSAPAAQLPIAESNGYADEPEPPSIEYIAMHSNNDHASCSGSGELQSINVGAMMPGDS